MTELIGVSINLVYEPNCSNVEEKLMFSLISNSMLLRGYVLQNRYFCKITTYEEISQDTKEIIFHVSKYFPELKGKIKSIFISHVQDFDDVKDKILG